jgi:hypothetical protein
MTFGYACIYLSVWNFQYTSTSITQTFHLHRLEVVKRIRYFRPATENTWMVHTHRHTDTHTKGCMCTRDAGDELVREPAVPDPHPGLLRFRGQQPPEAPLDRHTSRSVTCPPYTSLSSFRHTQKSFVSPPAAVVCHLRRTGVCILLGRCYEKRARRP